MRILRRMLLAASGCLAVALLVAAGSAARAAPTTIQTGSYPWVQPWASGHVSSVTVQPPAFAGRVTVRVFAPPRSYHWAQPWGARPAGTTEPALVPG
jgi:hypothetical protein